MLSDLFVTRISIDSATHCEPYVEQLPVVCALRDSPGIEIASRITILVGENGVGKSTLIEALAVNLGFNPEGGTRNFNFTTADTHSSLSNALKVLKGIYGPEDGFFLRAEAFYNTASYIDQLDSEGGFGAPLVSSYGGTSLHHQSHGESFMAVAENRFGNRGLYILDEPEAALSPQNILRLMVIIEQLVQQGSQFFIATHSPLLMALPKAQVLQLSEEGINPVDYRETSHFQITKAFLNNPEKMLGYLFEEEENEASPEE